MWEKGKEYSGEGKCFWTDSKKDKWLFTGKLQEGKPCDGEVVLESLMRPEIFFGVFSNLKRVGNATLIENGKQYYVEYGENETVKIKKRMFGGVRIMLMGDSNVFFLFFIIYLFFFYFFFVCFFLIIIYF